jgi:MarR family transcriptional repressor of emrRAB
MDEDRPVDTRVAPADLDYWSFVELARRRLDETFGENDSQATKVILTLNRAASLVTYDLGSTIHRPRGSSWSAFRLMFVVWIAGHMESNIAARLTGMSRAAVSNLSNALIGKGLLQKDPSAHDRRMVILSLTPAGLAEIRETSRQQNEREALWANGLSEVEQDALVGLLDKLISARTRFDGKERA